MPPKAKESATKKPVPQVLRPSISDSSLNQVPDDAIEGYQERIETGIEWTLLEDAVRRHKQKCTRDNIPEITFSKAFKNKIKHSILNGFMEPDANLQEQWEVFVPMKMWDIEKFANDEGKICFKSSNNLTDDMSKLIKRSVLFGDKKTLRRDLKKINVLRVTDSEMTELDKSLMEFDILVTLNLCGNYLTEIDACTLPQGLRMLELQANHISNLVPFVENLPTNLIYLGLARNFLDNSSVEGISKGPHYLTVLDISDNDICDLDMVLDALSTLPSLTGLHLAGNPCSVCAAYARSTLIKLPRLQWLDYREVLVTDRPLEPVEPHPDDLRSAYFTFTVFRIISAPQPPKPDKGAVTAFHVELELPLLDSSRRQFLMFRNNESLIEMLPPPEDEEWPSTKFSRSLIKLIESKSAVEPETSSHESDIYNRLTTKNSREIIHYTIFESNRVQWNKLMNFQEPTIKIFCPNLRALRDTFRTTITLRVIYSVTTTGKQSKPDKKSAQNLKPPGEQRVTLATVKCSLRKVDWSQPSQHFHWDDSLGTDEAIHWGDGDLSVLQYTLAAVKTTKGKPDSDPGSTKQYPPDNFTCHFGFGIDTLKA
ncbi:hypothetical protein KGM_214113 [Danaus plexippus plexippus]|uniref:Uncharacterized protein n=1 Tax=Danaus plexippus plexippus TaxID=278856 RepID=A0A212FDU1_DANPL|nr:hypothetical protein KGM_214113 [Danaus plexippus plexippus]